MMAIADAMKIVYRFMDGATHGDLEGETYFCNGHQKNPFFAEDSYYVDGVGAASFTLANLALSDKPVIGGGDLNIVLIRSACFFQGRVPNRMDPTACARVLPCRNRCRLGTASRSPRRGPDTRDRCARW